jgi:hemoglobin-like flavoprotein
MNSRPTRKPGQRTGLLGGAYSNARPCPADAPFNRKKIGLLRRTFAQIEAQAGIAGLVFYQRLFTLDPSLRPLFQTSIELQTRKLMDSLRYAVATLENPKVLVPVLEAMGRRHLAYGVRDQDYEVVIRALLESFEQILGGQHAQETHEAWREALCFVAEAMKQGAARAIAGGKKTARFRKP